MGILQARMVSAALFLCAVLPTQARIDALDLIVLPEDIRIAPGDSGGYDLYVRKKGEIASILLTETTRDPAMKAHNFAYRALDFNGVNGGEKRLLNGKFLPASGKLYSLISSTPRPDPALGQAFHVLIPPVLVYGYSWSRSGTVAVGKGTFINIRTFQKPYGDYTGAYLDNPYEITIAAKPLPPPPPPVEEPPKPPEKSPPSESYSPEASADFTAVADATKGKGVFVPEDGSTSNEIGALLDDTTAGSLDLVICLDTTGSMTPYIDELKRNLTLIVRERVARFRSFRVGLMLFKDYWPDVFITRKMPFTRDIGLFDGAIKSITSFGGTDIPEAVHEALYAAATEFDWSADTRLIILVGDAPPHPEPRGKIRFSDVVKAAAAASIEIDALIEPVDKKGNK